MQKDHWEKAEGEGEEEEKSIDWGESYLNFWLAGTVILLSLSILFGDDKSHK